MDQQVGIVKTKIISKNDLHPWLEHISKTNQLIAPIEIDGIWKYSINDDASSVKLDFPSPVKGSLREHFTPETETLFEYKLSGQSVELNPVDAIEHNRVIFGARACDGTALEYVDTVYSNIKPIDNLYFGRRNLTTIIGVFCNNPSWSCFCTEVNNALTNPVNIDLMLTDMGEKYLAEIYTEKGGQIADFEGFKDASQEDIDSAKSIKSAVVSKLPEHQDHAAKSLSYKWDHDEWRKLAQKCLGCGICTFMCPTCHCFDMQECSRGNKGNRFRCWDTCQFEKFTLMGQGHNPRPSKKERTRQRVFHKFKYSQERYQMLGCVGCGRCIASCPVNIDIKKTVQKLEAETDNE